MAINIRSKSCPNCGANLKFDINDVTTICSYCGSQIQIEHQKREDNLAANSLYVNKNGEIFKWISKAIISVIELTLGLIFSCIATPIFGILIILAGVFTLIPSTTKVFFKKFWVKLVIVSVLIVVGFFGAIMNVYKIPLKFHGKYISDTTNMTVEIKGNQIIVNDNGKITKDEIYCWSQTYGTISYYNIKVNNGEYNFRLTYEGYNKYRFYNVVHYNAENYFYRVKHEDEYAHYEGDE